MTDTKLPALFSTAFFAAAVAMAARRTRSKGGKEIAEFDEKKTRYRQRRDEFRKNEKAVREVEEWKARNDECDYLQLGSGMIPKSMIGKSTGESETPYVKSDTWFSEFPIHNPPNFVLSTSPSSLIIANSSSYDQRQYPPWVPRSPPYQPGVNTPEGQAFGHTLVISRKRLFNVVDYEATQQGCELLTEMKTHFINFWSTEKGKSAILERTRTIFEEQNAKLASIANNNKNNSEDPSPKSTFETTLLPKLKADYNRMAKRFPTLDPDDFEYGFHAWPDNSVGHLHMHVFPKPMDFRKFSGKRHDWKTIPLAAVLEVEAEDGNKDGQQGGKADSDL